MRRVLIVDDEVLVRIGIKHSIAWEQNGFELIGEASDGKEALEMIQKLAPDIVILDINMPVLNGIEVLRELKEQKYKGKVIVLTCFNEIEYARSAMKYGASDYVLKTTLNTDELLNALLDLEFDDNNFNEPLTLPSREKMSEEEAVTRILEGYESDFQSKKLKASNLYCILVKIEQLSEVLDRYKEKKPDFFYTSLHSMIGQVVAGQKECVYIQYKPNRCVIFLSFSGQPSTQECYLKIRAIVNHLVPDVELKYLAVPKGGNGNGGGTMHIAALVALKNSKHLDAAMKVMQFAFGNENLYKATVEVTSVIPANSEYFDLYREQLPDLAPLVDYLETSQPFAYPTQSKKFADRLISLMQEALMNEESTLTGQEIVTQLAEEFGNK